MPKKPFQVLLLTILSLSKPHHASASGNYQKIYESGSSMSMGYPLQTDDSGFVIISTIVDSSFSNTTDILFLKTDRNGVPIATRRYSTPYYDQSLRACKTLDGGYIIAGTQDSTGSGLSVDLLVIKTDEDGIIQWSLIAGGNGFDLTQSIIPTPDSGCIIGAQTSSFSGFENAYLLKLDKNGNKLWSRVYENAAAYGMSVKPTLDGGYVIAGSGTVGTDIVLIKTDSQGFPEWSKNYDSGMEDYSNDVVQLPDSSYILVGDIRDGDYQIFIKTEKTGNFLWAKTLFSSVGGDQIRMHQVSIDRNGNIITLGNANSSSFNFDDALVCLDTSGNVLWSNLYGSSGSDFCGSFMNLPDGSFIFTGDANGFGSAGCYVVKTAEDGGSDCNFLETVTTDTSFNLITDTGIVWTNPQDFVQLISMVTDSVFVNETILCQSTGLVNLPQHNPTFGIFPNPASGNITIEPPSDSQTETYLNIFNNLGQTVYSVKLEGKSTTIPTGEFDNGIYKCVILDNFTGRIQQSNLIIAK